MSITAMKPHRVPFFVPMFNPFVRVLVRLGIRLGPQRAPMVLPKSPRPWAAASPFGYNGRFLYTRLSWSM